MFDNGNDHRLGGHAPGSLTALPAKPLGAPDVESWTGDLSAALERPDGLTDRERVDLIRALERLTCVATAAQAGAARALDVSQQAAQSAAGEPAARRGRGVAEQVALARRESPHRGRQHLALARIVERELPHTWAAWRSGRITEWKATIVARETACLALDDRLAVDEHVAADHDALEAMGERAIAGACLAMASRLDAEALVARRRKAEGERRVTLRPAPDTMTYLTALLPVKDGVGVFAALTRAADSARAAGDARGRGQAMADALVDAVLSSAGLRVGGADGGSRGVLTAARVTALTAIRVAALTAAPRNLPRNALMRGVPMSHIPMRGVPMRGVPMRAALTMRPPRVRLPPGRAPGRASRSLW